MGVEKGKTYYNYNSNDCVNNSNYNLTKSHKTWTQHHGHEKDYAEDDRVVGIAKF